MTENVANFIHKSFTNVFSDGCPLASRKEKLCFCFMATRAFTTERREIIFNWAKLKIITELDECKQTRRWCLFVLGKRKDFYDVFFELVFRIKERISDGSFIKSDQEALWLPTKLLVLLRDSRAALFMFTHISLDSLQQIGFKVVYK